MRELVRTNNAVLITVIESLLKAADIGHAVLDQHMSVLEGSLGMLPRRIVVADDDHDGARRLLEDAGLAHELRPLPRGSVPADETDDAVLGGRLRLLQPKRGHRVGHDAILLAAAVDAREGDRLVEFGAGVGAAGLALARRVGGVSVTLVERDPELASLLAQNIERNGFAGCVIAITADVEDLPASARAGVVDHVFMNPPFHDPARQNVSPDAGRRAAHVGGPDLLSRWIAAAERVLHSAGALTLIWRADGLADVLAALGARFGGMAVLPVYGGIGQPAIRVLVRAERSSRAPLRLLPGLVLTGRDGKSTPEADAVLRDAAPLPLTDR